MGWSIIPSLDYASTIPNEMDDASTSTWNSFDQSRKTKIGAITNFSLSLSNTFWHSSAHINGVSFMNNFSNDIVICFYPCINILWYPNSMHNNLIVVGETKSIMTVIFVGSTIIPSLQTICPSKTPTREQKYISLYLHKYEVVCTCLTSILIFGLFLQQTKCCPIIQMHLQKFMDEFLRCNYYLPGKYF